MRKNQVLGIVIFALVSLFWVAVANYEMATGSQVLPYGVRLFLWYGLVLYVCYQAIWGYFAKVDFGHTGENEKQPRGEGMLRHLYVNIWHFSAAALFVVSTVGFFIGISSLIIR